MIIITDCLYKQVATSADHCALITMRKLSPKEMQVARTLSMTRYAMPPLSGEESQQFFEEFRCFWEQVVVAFDSQHYFWRNVVSSKMQEWENSLSYFALLLYTLKQKAAPLDQNIVVVCSSLQEEEVCRMFAEQAGWKVVMKSRLRLPVGMRKLLQEAKNVKHFAYQLIVCGYKWFYAPRRLPSLQETGNILIASYCYSHSFQNKHYSDPFFGKLHEFIREKGSSVVYLCDSLGKYKETAQHIEACKDANILSPYSIVPWRRLLAIAWNIFWRRVRLPSARFMACDFSPLLRWNFRRFEQFFNFGADIYYAAVQELARYRCFATLVQLYEGNVFERGCIQAFKRYHAGSVLGYSHAVIFPLNLKMQLMDAEKKARPEPDRFITAGEEITRLMGQVCNYDIANLQSGCSLRHIPKASAASAVKQHILIALDGVGNAVVVLDWLIDSAEILKDYTVVIRAHPNVDLGSLLSQSLRKFPAHFRASNQSLDEDIHQSFCVMYRQTSVGMQALLNGIPVVHLAVDAPLSCDPMARLQAGKHVVRTSQELGLALRQMSAINFCLSDEALNEARDYIARYFEASTGEKLAAFLNESFERG